MAAAAAAAGSASDAARVAQFFDRLRLPRYDAGAYVPSAAALAALQDAYALAMPFENLDITHLKRAIVCDEHAVLRKLIDERRGGFCFELNGGMAWLLTTLGYHVDRLSARMWRPASGFGRRHTHMVLRVTLDAVPYLVDVGNGNCPYAPLRFDDGVVQTAGQRGRAFVMRRCADSADGVPTWRLYERLPWGQRLAVPSPDGTTAVPQLVAYSAIDATEPMAAPPPDADAGAGAAAAAAAAAWADNLVFEVEVAPVPYATFDAMCVFHQTDAASPFQQGMVVTLGTPSGGRVTVATGVWSGALPLPLPVSSPPAGIVLSTRRDAHTPRDKVELPPHALAAALDTYFGIRLPPGVL